MLSDCPGTVSSALAFLLVERIHTVPQGDGTYITPCILFICYSSGDNPNLRRRCGFLVGTHTSLFHEESGGETDVGTRSYTNVRIESCLSHPPFYLHHSPKFCTSQRGHELTSLPISLRRHVVPLMYRSFPQSRGRAFSIQIPGWQLHLSQTLTIFRRHCLRSGDLYCLLAIGGVDLILGY